MQSWKAVVLKHLLVLDHSGWENYETNIYGLTIRFIQTHFNQPDQFHEYSKLYRNITQYFPPHSIIGIPEVYCCIELPFLLQYLKIAVNLIHICCYIETHISPMYGLNLERRIFKNILYEVESSDIPR
jgi:hypothetical protein